MVTYASLIPTRYQSHITYIHPWYSPKYGIFGPLETIHDPFQLMKSTEYKGEHKRWMMLPSLCYNLIPLLWLPDCSLLQYFACGRSKILPGCYLVQKFGCGCKYSAPATSYQTTQTPPPSASQSYL